MCETISELYPLLGMRGSLQFSVFTTLNTIKYVMDVLAQAATLPTTLWDTLGSNLGQGSD